MATKYKMAELRDYFIGKKIFFYDGFSGSRRHFVIGKVIDKGNCIELQPKNNPNLWVFINKNNYPVLQEEGKTIYKGEIEGCRYEVFTEIRQWHT